MGRCRTMVIAGAGAPVPSFSFAVSRRCVQILSFVLAVRAGSDRGARRRAWKCAGVETIGALPSVYEGRIRPGAGCDDTPREFGRGTCVGWCGETSSVK